MSQDIVMKNCTKCGPEVGPKPRGLFGKGGTDKVCRECRNKNKTALSHRRKRPNKVSVSELE